MYSENEFDSFSNLSEEPNLSDVYFNPTNPFKEIDEEKKNEIIFHAIEKNFPYNTPCIKEKTNNNDEEQLKCIYTTFTDKLRKKKIIIFRIRKYKLKPGRRKKNALFKSAIKDKYHKDNIQNKIMTNFINSTLHYLNLHLSEKKMKLLQKIVPLIKEYSNTKKTKIFLKKTIGEIFSSSVSGRNTRFKNDKNYNKRLIQNLRKNILAIEINNILDKTVKEMYEIYISNAIPEYSLNNELIKLERKENDNDYIHKYENIASKLIEIVINKKSRNRSKLLYK